MLKHRVMTAIVLFPLLLWTILEGNRGVWVVVLSLCVGLSVFESLKMLVPALTQKIVPTSDRPPKMTSHWVVFGIFISIMLFLASVVDELEFSRGILPVFFSVTIIYAVFTAKIIEVSVIRFIGLIVGIVYGCLPWLAVWSLYNLGDQGRYVLFMVFVVVGCDTGAYFGGKAFGKRKMSKMLSPNKTWEGLFAGVTVAVLTGTLANYIFDGNLGNAWLIVYVSILGALAGVLGDLVESALKRFSGVKDSGKIFPGHGGFLDRVDAILFAAPTIWFMLYVLS